MFDAELKQTTDSPAEPSSPPSEGILEVLEESIPSTGRIYGSVEPHIFSDPQRAQTWRETYGNSEYECRHRFDPSFQWSAKSEVILKRKLDWRVMIWVWVMFSSLDLVRRNINRVVSDNFLNDIKITTNDYNTGQTIFLLSFLAFELPGGLISKKVGPFRYTPMAIAIWGGLCMAQAGIKNRWSFFLLRALVGASQGGFIPEMVLYLSYFYKGNELPIRLSIFFSVIPLTQTYGSILAAGLLDLEGVRGWKGWQWLFLVEGLLCVVVGAISFFVMPASITEPALAFKRPDGSNKWWTEEEEKILVNRLLRDDPTKGDLNNRAAVTPVGILKALADVDQWPVFLLGISAYIGFQPTLNYLSLTLRDLGYSVFVSNVLAIPGFVIFAANTFFFAWLSEHFNERLLIASVSNIWMLPFFAGIISIKPDANPWVRYVLLTGINGLPYTHSILVGMISKNAKAVDRRTVCACLYNMGYQVGSIVAANIYRADDAPFYYKANRALVGLCSANILLFVLAKLYYIWRNRTLDKQLAGLPESERSRAKLDVRFSH